MVISCSFKVFLKLPEIIIIGFGENNVSCPIYVNFGVTYMAHLTFFVLLLKKTEKVQEYELY